MGCDDPPTAGTSSPIDAESIPQTEQSVPPSRFSSFAAALILLLILLTPAVGFWWLRGMAREAVERSVLSHTRDMLIRYFARTDGAWPRSWDDLAPDFEPADAGYGTPDLDALKGMVKVDFTFDPAAVFADRMNSDEPPRVIWFRNQSDTDDVRDVNARLIEALRQRRR
ncbi:MAG: hypothetical protein AB7U20_15250 [Planctomycetaceae bacterium]